MRADFADPGRKEGMKDRRKEGGMEGRRHGRNDGLHVEFGERHALLESLGHKRRLSQQNCFENNAKTTMYKTLAPFGFAYGKAHCDIPVSSSLSGLGSSSSSLSKRRELCHMHFTSPSGSFRSCAFNCRPEFMFLFVFELYFAYIVFPPKDALQTLQRHMPSRTSWNRCSVCRMFCFMFRLVREMRADCADTGRTEAMKDIRKDGWKEGGKEGRRDCTWNFGNGMRC